MESNQNKRSALYYIVGAFITIVSVAIIVLSVLQIFDVWDKAINVLVPLEGLNLLGLAYVQWKPNRKVAYFSIGAAVFIFICTIIVFFVK